MHCLIEKNTVITKPICSLWILKQKKTINAGGWDLAEMWNEGIYCSLTANAKVATGFEPIVLSVAGQSEGRQMKLCWIKYYKKSHLKCMLLRLTVGKDVTSGDACWYLWVLFIICWLEAWYAKVRQATESQAQANRTFPLFPSSFSFLFVKSFYSKTPLTSTPTL